MNAIKFEAARVGEPSPPLLFKLPNSWGRLRDKVIGAPYDDLYGKAPPERGTGFRYMKRYVSHHLNYLKG